MENLANALVAGLELVEAEGRSLRTSIVGMTMRLGLAVVAAICVGVGAFMILRGAYLGLVMAVGEAWACVISGILFAGTGAGIFLIARAGRKRKAAAKPKVIDPKDMPDEGVRYDSPLQPQPAVG